MSKEVTVSGIFKDRISGPSAKAASNLTSSFKGAEKSTKGLSLGFASMAGAVGGVAASVTSKLLSAVAKLPGAMLKASTSVEDLTLQFTTLLGSTEAAQARMEELVKFAADTPFDLPELATASRVLETLTQGALSSGEGLRMVGDAAAASGSEFENLAMHIGRAYGGLMSNRAIGESMSRLQELGAVAPEVRNQIEALQKASKGKEAWEVLRAELDKSRGAMELMSKSTNGIIRNIKDNLDAAFRDIVGGSMDGFKKALTFIKDVMDDLSSKGVFKKFGESIKTAFAVFIGSGPDVEKTVDTISKAFNFFGGAAVVVAGVLRTAWITAAAAVDLASYAITDALIRMEGGFKSLGASAEFAGGLVDRVFKAPQDISTIAGALFGNTEKGFREFRKILDEGTQSTEQAAIDLMDTLDKMIEKGLITTDQAQAYYARAEKKRVEDVRKITEDLAKVYPKQYKDYVAYLNSTKTIRERVNTLEVQSAEALGVKLQAIQKETNEKLSKNEKKLADNLATADKNLEIMADRMVAYFTQKKQETPEKTAVPGVPTAEDLEEALKAAELFKNKMRLMFLENTEIPIASGIVNAIEKDLNYVEGRMAAIKSVQQIYIDGITNEFEQKRAQTEASLNENIEAIRQSVSEGYLLEQEGEDAITQLRQNAANKRTEIAKEEAKERQEIQQDTFDAVINGISTVNNAISQVFQYQQQKEDERTQRQIDNVKQNVRGKRAQEDAIRKIEENAEKERKKIRKRELMLSWATAIANTAEGVSKAIAQGGVAGIITGAAVAAAGTIQTGIILSQISKLAKGGIVGGQGQSDTEPALLTPGEMVLNKGQQAKLFALANGASAPGGAGSNITFNESIVVHGNLDSAAAEQIRVDREKQLMGLKSMMQELSYRGQLSASVFA